MPVPAGAVAMVDFRTHIQRVRARLRGPVMTVAMTVAVLLAIAFVPLGLAWQSYLMNHSPEAPDIVTTQTEMMSSHGHVVYVRAFEKAAFEAMIGFGCGMLALVLIVGRLIYGPEPVQAHVPGLGWILLGVLALVLLAVFLLTGGIELSSRTP